jgi:hypothetical protein
MPVPAAAMVPALPIPLLNWLTLFKPMPTPPLDEIVPLLVMPSANAPTLKTPMPVEP